MNNSDCASERLPRTFERFTLLRRVARGGMGEVYLAASGGIEGAERPVIVKLIRRDHESDASFLARFLDEARIQTQLQHPGVAQVLEAANDAHGKPYVVVEYIEGRNLADVRSRAGQLGLRVGWPEAAVLGIALGSALVHVHERTDASGRPLEIVHRDLSPQNVMVSYDGDVKLIDFGTARGENRRCHTIAGIVFAKPGYVAPEVANNQPGGVPADLYAFGVMLWEMVAGRRFLVGEASVHLAAVGSGRRVPSPIARAAGAPPELDTIIAKLTATQIEDRYSSAREVTTDLARLLQRAPSLADGDRSVRGRIAHLMHRMYPAEPARSRSEFARLVAEARALPAPKQLLPPSPEAPAVEEDPALLPGTRYRVEGELGRGASGVVYRALHVDLGRRVALKVLDKMADSSAIERFRAEARAIASIEHRNLVHLYEFGTTREKRAFYAMELCEGETLDKKLEREGALPVANAVELVAQAASAVEAAHLAGVVHRDIKPANLIVTADGTLRLLDFGVAKAESEIARESEALVVIGTPEYMAPEQARGGQADAQSDVYALGVVLYELLTGALPHRGATVVALLEQKSTRDPAPLAQAAPERRFAPALDALVRRALARDPAGRPKSAGEFREALLAIELCPPLPPARRKRVTLSLASALVLVVSVTLGFVSADPARRGRLVESLGTASTTARAWSARLSARLLPSQREPQAKQPAVAAQAHRPADTPGQADPDRMEPAPDVAHEAEGETVEPGPAGEPALADATQDAAEGEGARPASAPTAPDTSDEARLQIEEAESLAAKNLRIKALHVMRKAGAKFPSDGRVLKAWVQAAEELKAWGEARKVARSWAKVDGSIESRLVLARLERATGNRERAIAILRELAAEAPQSQEVRELLSLYGGGGRLALNH